MLLKSMKLKDFRQFKGSQEIKFSCDREKNVTIILGMNASGKTTLAQAFIWCLYGDTDFEDKMVMNKATAKDMLPNSEEKVRVEIELIHNKLDYTLIREQRFSKDKNGLPKQPNQTSFHVSYKNVDGQREFVNDLQTEMQMKNILPKELSKYFFFDGERIGNMGKEIRRGRSKEFAQAVRNLLGLSAFISAIEHLNGKPPKKSVIKSYDDNYDSKSNDKLEEYKIAINQLENDIADIDKNLADLEYADNIAKERCMSLNDQIKANEESEKLAEEKEKLKEKILRLNSLIKKNTSNLLGYFNTNAPGFFSKKLINDALSILSEADELTKGIPDIHARTIEFLIRRGFCLCGNTIEDGNISYKKLKGILEYIPPQSIGNAINQFTTECELNIKNSDVFFNEITDKYSQISEYEDEIDEAENEIKFIENKLKSLKNVGKLQEDLMKYESGLRDNQDERDKLNQRKGQLNAELEKKSASRKEITLKDENNRKIETYKAYAQYLYNTLCEKYKHEEEKTRNQLQKTINNIFKTIYNGGLALTLDDKYNIQITVIDVDGYNDEIETSTAQSISIIFSFIAGVIQLARESNKPENKMLVSEPYPLVMDAPLSAFDKTRIKSVCEVLPNVAEQIILFIKDTDGELAEIHMGRKLGKKLNLVKKNEIETYIESR